MIKLIINQWFSTMRQEIVAEAIDGLFLIVLIINFLLLANEWPLAIF